MTPQQAQFVAEYLIDFNATQAALRAGYSPKSAHAQGHRLLKDAEVSKAIEEGMEARMRRTLVSQDRVVAELAKIAFADPRDVMTWGPDGVRFKDSEEMDAASASIVAEVSETKDGMKVKLHDKQAALTALARHLGMFIDKTEHTGPSGGPIVIERRIVDPKANG